MAASKKTKKVKATSPAKKAAASKTSSASKGSRASSKVASGTARSKKTVAKKGKTKSSPEGTATKKTVARKSAKSKTSTKRVATAKKSSVTKAARKATAKTAASKKTAAKKSTTSKRSSRKAAPVKKVSAKKSDIKKSTAAKKPSIRKVAKKAAAKNTASSAAEKKQTPPRGRRPSPSAVRRAKEKEKGAKSPFSHTDHASVFRGVEARKAAAKAKQARAASKTSKPKRGNGRRLTDKQLEEFKDMLMRIRAELLRQIAYLRGASLTRADEVNPEEDGTDAFERQLALKLAAGEGDSIFEIDEALERIRLKVYGVCEECACLVPSPRLKALPFARRCVECQSKVEQNPRMSDHRYF